MTFQLVPELLHGLQTRVGQTKDSLKLIRTARACSVGVICDSRHVRGKCDGSALCYVEPAREQVVIIVTTGPHHISVKQVYSDRTE